MLKKRFSGDREVHRIPTKRVNPAIDGLLVHVGGAAHYGVLEDIFAGIEPVGGAKYN